MDIHSKGFITVAAGDYYCKLAQHLYMSYKLFGKCEYPFYVITDEAGREQLATIFDGVIVRNDLQYNWLDKLLIFTDTPFEETIFLDADCSVVNGISYVFDLFENCQSDISAISYVKELKMGEHGIQFGNQAVTEFGLKYDYPKFNGGVYFYRKTKNTDQYIDFMMKTIVPKYHELGLLSGQKREVYDEPIVIMAMLFFGMKPISPEENVMYLVQDAKNVDWDMVKQKCRFEWDNRIVSPTIIHWKVGGTETLKYEMYDAKLRGQYFGESFLATQKAKLLVFVKYSIYPSLLKIMPSIRKLARKIK